MGKKNNIKDNEVLSLNEIEENGALIYFDVDMRLNAPLGDVWLPDGVGIYHAAKKTPTLENSIQAVNRANHPALRNVIQSIEVDFLGKVTPGAVYASFVRTLETYFTPKKNECLSEFIAFPLQHMIPDESQNNGVVSYNHTL
nr:hypothetical protein [unidentified bacterial endosymbiont]